MEEESLPAEEFPVPPRPPADSALSRGVKFLLALMLRSSLEVSRAPPAGGADSAGSNLQALQVSRPASWQAEWLLAPLAESPMQLQWWEVLPLLASSGCLSPCAEGDFC